MVFNNICFIFLCLSFLKENCRFKKGRKQRRLLLHHSNPSRSLPARFHNECGSSKKKLKSFFAFSLINRVRTIDLISLRSLGFFLNCCCRFGSYKKFNNSRLCNSLPFPDFPPFPLHAICTRGHQFIFS